MPVIINELTVEVSDGGGQTRGGGGGEQAQAPSASPALGAPEVAAFLERRERQQLRTFAH